MNYRRGGTEVKNLLCIDKNYINPIARYYTPNIYQEFLKVPFSTITHIRWGFLHESDPKNPYYMTPDILEVYTSSMYKLNNIFRLQVSGTTTSGETVACVEPISIHIIEIFTTMWPVVDGKKKYRYTSVKDG